MKKAHKQPTQLSKSLIVCQEAILIKPDFHSQWKLHQVIYAGDQIIKILDTASCNLRYKMVKHWDLEEIKVIRHFHGHLTISGVYSSSYIFDQP
ncbi:uncharacterized protein MELLADRAFT_87663 [Melampsora larici-populina 98AG31]|uniref:Uncharacterized protein n=1 Tax=Melampsora larici-populina (strain 98AG31 / pathotype 3-4-7) TaxID=747676 RepID=F4RP88_MELLP|nr:uncharacterized protein MELLADRAFT_87663 [Melampsora larici-populina 98AG31]EGG05893.1 hypothetical protein MELLADRAFT_87663 [Melampsora larici-populina 98AG31]